MLNTSANRAPSVDGAASVTVTERFITAPDGVRLHCVEYVGERADASDGRGEGGGDPILCLHGLTRNARDFDVAAPQLAADGRRVIAATQRGRGASDPDPDPHRYTPATYVPDMFALMDALDVARADILGTSMGGLMAMMMAAVAPERVGRIVLNDIGPQIEPAGLERISGYVGGGEPVSSWQAAAERVRAINGPAFPNETGDAFWMQFAKRVCRALPDGRVALDYDPAIAIPVLEGDVAPPDLWPVFDAIVDHPILVVRGGLSDLLSPQTIEDMRARKPDLKVVVADQVGHAPTLAEDDVWPAVRAFLLTP